MSADEIKGHPMAEEELFRFFGVNRRGAQTVGVQSADSAAALAERLFALRWREATIFAYTDSSATPLAQVGTVDGKRTWWGES